MGLSGVSLTEILIILAIVVLLFGTSKLSRVGGDLGAAIRLCGGHFLERAADVHRRRAAHLRVRPRHRAVERPVDLVHPRSVAEPEQPAKR